MFVIKIENEYTLIKQSNTLLKQPAVWMDSSAKRSGQRKSEQLSSKGLLIKDYKHCFQKRSLIVHAPMKLQFN